MKARGCAGSLFGGVAGLLMFLFVGEIGAGEARNDARVDPFEGLEYRLIGPAGGGRAWGWCGGTSTVKGARPTP